MRDRTSISLRPIRLIIGSNDVHLRSLLRRSLSDDGRLQVVGDSANGDDVVSDPTSFDVALLDLSLQGLGILRVMSHLKTCRPSRPVIVITQHDALYLRHALEAEGAADYLLIPERLGDLADRIVQVHEAAQLLPARAERQLTRDGAS